MRNNLIEVLNPRRFLKARSGASAMEFAIVAPVFVLLLAGMFEIAMVSFVGILAEGGLREASRYGITGQTPGTLTREERLVQIVEEHTHGLISVSPSNVTFTVYEDFEHIGTPEPYEDNNPANGQYDPGESFTDWNDNAQWDVDPGVTGVGGAGDIVLYRIEYQWEFMTKIFSVFGGADGRLDMSTTIAVRNEPYEISGTVL